MLLYCFHSEFGKNTWAKRLVFDKPEKMSQPAPSLEMGVFTAQKDVRDIMETAERDFAGAAINSFNPDLIKSHALKELQGVEARFQESLRQGNIVLDDSNDLVRDLRASLHKAPLRIEKYYKEYTAKMRTNVDTTKDVAQFHASQKAANDKCIYTDSLLNNFFYGKWPLNDSPQKVTMRCGEALEDINNRIKTLRQIAQRVASKVAGSGTAFFNIIQQAEKSIGGIKENLARITGKLTDVKAMNRLKDTRATLERQMADHPDDERLQFEHHQCKKAIRELMGRYGIRDEVTSDTPPVEVKDPDKVDGKTQKEQDKKTTEIDKITPQQIPEVLMKRILENAVKDGKKIILTIEGKAVTLVPDEATTNNGKEPLYVMEGQPHGFNRANGNGNEVKVKYLGKPLRLATAEAIAYVLNLQKMKVPEIRDLP